MRGRFKLPPQHLENTLDVAENIVIPDPNCPISELAHHCFALGIGGAVRVLAPIDLDDEVQIPTDEISKVRSNRFLPHELETGQLSIA